MGLREQIQKQKQNLVKQTERSVQTTGDSGASYRSIFIPEKLPKGIGFWKCGVGDHFIDLIPWLAGANHPFAQEGEGVFNVDLFVHQGIGAARDNWVCTTKTFKIPDVICNYITKNKPNKDEWNQIKPKRRTAYLVWVHDTPEEEEKGIQIWECAHHIFQRHIDAISMMPKGGGVISYADLEDGKTIRFKVTAAGKFKTADGREAESREYLGHSFFDRQERIPDELLEMVFCLDDAILWKPSNKDVQLSFYGTEQGAGDSGEDDGGEQREAASEAPPTRRFGARTAPAEEEREPAEAPPPAKRRFGSSAPAEAPPETPTRRFGAKPSATPPEESPEEQSGIVCPANGTVGVDHDKLPECAQCELWDPCADFADQIGGKPTPAAPAAPEKPKLRVPAPKNGGTVSKPTLTRRQNA
jgi:hypothetical protein